MSTHQNQSWRSLLFVPGDRSDRYEKACQSGADLICIDLEDAVAPDHKTKAREEAFDYLTHKKDRPCLIGVRVNGMTTADADKDLATLRRSEGVDFVMVPKPLGAADIDKVYEAYQKPMILPVLETPRAIQDVATYADHQAIAGALYGAVDLSAALRCDLSWDAHLYGRSQCIMAFAAASKTLFDAPSLNVPDKEGLYNSTIRGMSIGLHASAAIHPHQIETIHRAYTPSEAEIAHAHRVIQAFEAAGGGVTLLDGKLIELPVIKSAQDVLRRAK